ncbi:Outer membrane lipoprotein BamD-like domain-containing protein [Candidatus Magnetomoraceae bacterium gMMP-15]
MEIKNKANIIILICLLALPSFAKADLCINADQQFQFAESYFSRKEYIKAINEYERFIYFFSNDSRIDKARYQIGICYFRGNDFKNALKAFQILTDQEKLNPLRIQAYFKISECYIKNKAWKQALNTLYNLTLLCDNPDIRDEAYYEMGWICLKSGRKEQALNYLYKISEKNKVKYKLKSLSQALKKDKLWKTKNPELAGWLAIIPGAGHLYCKRYSDAFISFLLNTGLIYAAYESFDNDQPVLGGVISLFGTGFYSGNIYSAVSSAHKYNRHEQNKFLRYLKENYKVGLSWNKENTLLFSMHISF